MSITRDEEVLGGEPRIDGTRVAVRHVATRVVDHGQSVPSVADQLDLRLADVYAALSYYYDNLDAIRSHAPENEAAVERLRESSLQPREPAK